MDGYGGYEETIESRGGAAEHPLLNVGPTPRIECGAVNSFTGLQERIVGDLVGVIDTFDSSLFDNTQHRTRKLDTDVERVCVYRSGTTGRALC